VKVTIVPEELIWRFVGATVRNEADAKMPYDTVYDKLPAEIPVAEEFVSQWRCFVQGTVARAFVDVFGLRSFLILDGDTTKRIGTWAPAFWQETRLKFSNKAVARIWEQILSEATNKPPKQADVLPGDALLLTTLFPNWWNTYIGTWLEGKKAPWPVVAWFFLRGKYNEESSLPWLSLLEKPGELELPLRGLILELSGDLAEAIEEGLQQWIDPENAMNGSTSTEGLAQFRFQIHSAIDVMRLAGQKDPFGAIALRQAFDFWTDEGTLGYDDAKFLRGLVARTKVFSRFGQIQKQLFEVQQLLEERQIQ